MGSTLNEADVFGTPAGWMQTASPISSGGPNQSQVNPWQGGIGTAAGGSAPAFSLLGMVILLVAWRLAVEFGAD